MAELHRYRVLRALRINGCVVRARDVVLLRAEDAEDLIRCGYLTLVINGSQIAPAKWCEPAAR